MRPEIFRSGLNLLMVLFDIPRRDLLRRTVFLSFGRRSPELLTKGMQSSRQLCAVRIVVTYKQSLLPRRYYEAGDVHHIFPWDALLSIELSMGGSATGGELLRRGVMPLL